MSIRLRLIVWHSTVFAVGFVGFAFLIWFGTRAVLRNHIDTWLTRQADGLELFLKNETHGSGLAAVVEEAREFSSGLPRGSGIQLFDGSGTLVLSKPDIAIGGFSEEPSTLIADQARFRALTRKVAVAGDLYRYAMWRSLDETDAALDDLQLVLTLLVPAFLIASFAGGWFLSRRALRPVDEITQAARQISLTNLSGSLPVPRHGDELQRLSEAWNEMLGRLDDSARRLRQFTADASHELRTPVALIRTTADLALRQDRSPAEYQSSMRRIQEESQELTNVIENLMALARADSGHSRFSLVAMDLRELVSEIQLQVEPMASRNNLVLAVEVPQERLSIAGDRSALRRLLLLLLDNAVKFTTAPGRVVLRAVHASGEVMLEVEDTGMGISESDLPRIFDRFYQAEDSRSGGGAGLGLSIAKWIVQGHNGRIEVTSTLGHGSTFRVFLPAAE